MKYFNRIGGLLSRKKYIYIGIAVLGAVALGFFMFGRENSNYETITVVRGDFINQVSVSGKVVPSQDVELGFNNGGVIRNIYAAVGDKVRSGAIIAKIDAKDAEEEVHDAEIALSSAKLALEKLQLEKSEENMSADLAKAYDDGFTAVSDAFIDLPTIIKGLEDALESPSLSQNSLRASGDTALEYKADADKLYYVAKNSFEDSRRSFRTLSRNSPKKDIESIIQTAYDTVKSLSNALKSAKNLVDYMLEEKEADSGLASIRDSISEYIDTVSDHLSSLLSAEKDIKDNKDNFSTTGIEAKDLNLEIRQKENALAEARKRLSDYYITAPFSGVITRVDAKKGEIASSNEPLVAMMSTDTFQIESYVPEVNIALIKVGDAAKVTLDAYGDNILFSAKVVSVDPAETLRDGVSTYKIKLQFSEKDDRVKSGMTANVSIIIFNKPDTISLPGGVIFERDGKKFVRVKNGESIEEREVATGSISALGQVEIVSGLAGGEQVILNLDQK